ncbi:MAG: hypothetical protein C4547_10115 [Phycisphaerales bacterium]|nr:MAG: hypothetical protein C4547_10115 [Phycisphaerales bacterium]
MELPVHDDRTPATRSAEDVRAMAVVVQANLVQLKVEALRRRLIDPAAAQSVAVPPPGAVKRFREALLTPAALRGVADDDLPAALHETWGQYCTMCWLFESTGPGAIVNLAAAGDLPYRCDTPMQAKHAELHALLWRLLYEHRRRHDAAAPCEPAELAELAELARRIPARAIGSDVATCTDAELAAAICEHVGMITTLRWAVDATRVWGDPALREVDDRPF